MTPLEQMVRDDLAALAERTPLAPDLARAAIGRAREQRRRRAVWMTGGVLALVLAVSSTALLVSRGPADTTPPAGSPPPSVQSTDLDGLLRYRGAAVSVPKQWLDPDNLACGRPVQNAAYVPDPKQQKGNCTPPADRKASSQLTVVTLSPTEESTEIQATYADNIIADGRTQFSTRVPASDVWLVVTSPDPTLARKIYESLTIDAFGKCSGIWLSVGRRGNVPVTVDSVAELKVQVGETITARSEGSCPGLSMSPQSTILAPRLAGATAPFTELRAERPGTVRVMVTSGGVCDPVRDPQCVGGIGVAGFVDVTVVAKD
jgi:hypothetical protein